MKKWKIWLAVLLAVLLVAAVICVVALSGNQETPAPTESNTATVTFYNGDKVYETATVEIGAKLTLPKAPKAEKSKGLVGWSTIDGDVEEVIDPATFVVNADINLYAVWADVYTVTINPDNGQPFDVREVFAGTIIEKPADPVKEGFRFVEWRDALQETAFDFSQPIYADVIIKAMYGDGAPNRVSDTKWDFSTGIHGSWIGAQGGWKYEINGLPAEDMVYQTTEDGYAAWGFTLTDSLDNIPVIDGNNAAGLGMKYIYNEGISVAASKAKLVVVYLKPKYFPIDMATSPNDQFRISVLTSNGGMIYGYGSGSEAWSLRTDAGSKHLIQVDHMEDGWIRVQFKIHELEVWSEDAVIKGMTISFVQRKATPVMDVISVKSIELLDQEEFIDPHKIEYVTENQWDMTKEEESKDWFGVMSAGVDTNSVKTTINANGTQYIYGNTNKWRGMVLNTAKIDISKCSGIFSATIDVSGMNPTNYRLYIVTDKGGDLYKNSGRDDVSCYYAVTSATELADGWTVTPNADGTITIYYDLTKLEYWKNGTELQGLSFVTVDGTANGTVVYKSVSLADTVNKHNCETDGHLMKDATCTKPQTCSVCGVTKGEANGHSFTGGVCSVCGAPEYVLNEWDMSNKKEAADWSGYHAKKKNEHLTATVTEAGLEVAYGGTGNGWKGLVLENTALDISMLTGKLTFTYSSDMAITSYRIHILTDKGGNLTANGSADCYVAVKIADITAGSLEAWTQTTNADGSITVTFDLSTMSYFAKGTELKGLTIVTVTANNTTGTVTYKSIKLESKERDCQAVGHAWRAATCTAPKTCIACGATKGNPLGHTWNAATCTAPKTCSVCGTTKGNPLGHTWNDATCITPKTCSACGATEGELANHVDANGDGKCDNCDAIICTDHNWREATCIAPKTCSVCGATEGKRLAHTDADKDHVCDVCTSSLVIWYMNKEEDAADWSGYHAKKKNEALTATVTEAGLEVAYASPGNGWKGLVLEDAAIDISKLTGKLTFTYSSDMAITSYRIHILTDLGGKLTANGTADCYIAVSIADITAGNLEAWTQTTNADGSITVTFDLSTLNYFANGAELKGLTIVTVTANNTTGTVTYKSIELEKIFEERDCQVDGHVWNDATCTEPKTCSICGATEGEPAGHTWNEATCTEPKTCSVCGATEGDPAGHTWNDATCTAPKTCSVCGTTEGDPAGHTWNDATCTVPKTCSVCGATEGELGNHVDANGDYKCDNCEANLCTDHTWNDATCTAPKTCSVCGTTEGDPAGHSWNDATCTEPKICSVCGATEGEPAGHTWNDATCTEPKTCSVCGATEGEPAGHTWNDATCTEPKTCSVCGTTEGDPAGHTWNDATCTEPKTCSACGATEGEPLGHTWNDATCTAPKTCSICGATEGTRLAHTDADKDLVCDVCTDNITVWDMNKAADAIDWSGYHAKKKNEALTATVTEAGLEVAYASPGNGWKGLVLEGAAIDISMLTGKLTFTYSSDMEISSYRIHILTDKGGNLTANGTADCYVAVKIADITAGSLEAWTQTTNADGSITVTFELSTLNYFANGTELRGLTIVTVTANNTTGTVTYKSIELEKEEYDCQVNGHLWNDATCTAPKTCFACGTTEGEPASHTWNDATCTAPKTCSVCGATEGKRLAHTDADKDHVCDVCTSSLVIWYMNKEEDAAEWSGYHAKKKNEALTATVTEVGLEVAYASPGNGWKGLAWEGTAIDISKLTGKLTFTYSSDMAITNYRIHIVTDKGGDLTANGTADCYVAVSIADITAGNLEAWTQTTNADGSITVTFDLSTLNYFANGAELKGLTIVTVTANNTTGTVTYKSIELEKGEHDCQVDGHLWNDATCTEPKTCFACGTTEGEPAGHTWNDATCTEPKTCSVCGAKEGTLADHTFVEGVCSVCGAAENAPATPVLWDMTKQEDASQWYSAQAYTSVKPTVTTSEVTDAGFKANYGHKNGWKGIVLKNVEIDITGLSGLLSFTYYTEDMDFTAYRVHVLTDKGGDLESNTSGTPSDYYAAVAIGDIAQSEAWTRTENADGSVTVTFDLTTLPCFTEGTVLMGMDIVTVDETVSGEWHSITYSSIEIS